MYLLTDLYLVDLERDLTCPDDLSDDSALNGIRLMIVDFWPGAGKYQAPLWRMQMVVFTLAFVPSAAIMLARMF